MKQSACQNQNLISWLNKTLSISLQANVETIHRVEQLRTGVAYCRLINAFHPARLPIRKIIKRPKTKSECSQNLQTFLEAARSLGIELAYDKKRILEMPCSENNKLLAHLHQHFKRAVIRQNPTRKEPEVLMGSSSSATFGTCRKELQNYQQGLMGNKLNYDSIQCSSGTPMKLQNDSSWTGESIVSDIREIISRRGESDRFKVKTLKQKLGILDQEPSQSRQRPANTLTDHMENEDSNELLNDHKPKELIVLDPDQPSIHKP